MAKGVEVVCEVCGTVTLQGSNRPKLYCGLNNNACRDSVKYMRAMEKALNNIRFPEKERKARIKEIARELQLIRNTFNSK